MRASNGICMLALLTLVGACGSAAPTTTLSSSWTPPAALAYVPADTPYLLVSLDGTTEQFDDYVFGHVGATAAAWRAHDPDAASSSASASAFVRFGWALAGVVAGKDRVTWWHDLGLRPHGHFVGYGLGIWPVWRIEVDDPARARAAWGGAMLAAGARPATFAGATSWQIDADPVSIVLAVTGDELVVTLLPADRVALDAARAIGERAAHPIAASQVIAIANRHHVGTAYLLETDTRALVGQLVALAGTLKREGAGGAGIPPDCAGDAERLANLAPRFVVGYSRVDANEIDARFAVELAPELARGLDRLHVTMPPLRSTVATPLMSLQVAFDLDGSIAWLRGAAAVLAARPFTCAGLRDISDGAGLLRDRLDQPLPAGVHGLRGLQLVLDDATRSPPSGTGYALVSSSLLDLAALGPLPGLGSLPPAGAPPLALPTASLGIPNLSAHVGVGTDRAVLAVGPDSSARVARELTIPARDRAPLMQMSMNMVELGRLVPSVKLAGQESFFAQFANETMIVDIADDSLVFDVRATLKAK